MMMKGFLLLLLFGSVSCDRLKFHLENLVDRNVSACDDFYHHVCSQKVDPNEFFMHQSTFSLNEALKRLHPEAIKYSPIEYDLQHLRDDGIRKEDNNYEKLVRLRCKNDISCYKTDQEYYAAQMKSISKPVNDFLTIFSSNESLDDSIKTYINDTSRIIEDLIDYINSPFGFDENSPFNNSIMFHSSIQTRIRFIEFVESNNTFTDFHDIKEVAETMKRKMIDNLNRTQWLYGDEISESIFLTLKKRIASIELFHDFDDCDKNMTTLQKLIRDLNSKYFSVKSKTGIHRLDTLLRLNFAFHQLYVKSTKEMKNFISRIGSNFEWNAFFDSDLKTVTLLAPFMHKSVFQSDILTEPFITYFCLGHELHHSLFSRGTTILLNIYGERLQCVFDHYNQTCSKFARGACRSGEQTIIEDGPDIESWRTLISLLRDKYNDDELNKSVYVSEITLEQAFFYYVSSGFCSKDVLRTEEEAKIKKHSSYNIRVNGVLSLLPEFTKAFGCKKGDAINQQRQTLTSWGSIFLLLILFLVFTYKSLVLADKYRINQFSLDNFKDLKFAAQAMMIIFIILAIIIWNCPCYDYKEDEMRAEDERSAYRLVPVLKRTQPTFNQFDQKTFQWHGKMINNNWMHNPYSVYEV